MTRTFIALDLGEPQREHLAGVIQRMSRALPGPRWVDPAGIHLTLAFLGELTDEELARAIEAAQVAAQQVKPFSYRLSQPGIFDSLQRLRVIWMGIDEPTGKLQRLHRLLNRQLEQRGFTVDKRPFSPHLTLARVKAPLEPAEQQRLQRLLADTKLVPSSAPYRVQQLHVMKSELSRSGAKYTALASIDFGTTEA